ncbi:RANBP2-like and GRIP domain-containing protein 5/6, partial [Lingula anatina]
MSVYQTKSHVDKNVSMILSKLKTEKERNSRGLIIARQYYEVKEYEMAKRYCALYLTVKEQYAPAHKLMGQIHEALGQLDRAVACYKKCLELDGAQKDLVLKICQLYSKLKVDPDVAKYWAERAERLFPNHEAIFQLKEQIHMTNGNTAHDLEDLLAEELAKRPTDVKLRLKLLKLYQGNWRINDAYQHAISAEKTGAYNSSLEWYTHLVNLFQAYKEQANVDAMFYVNYLSALNNLVTLSMGHRNVADCAEALY